VSRRFDAIDLALIDALREDARATNKTLARSVGVATNRIELPGGDYTMDHSAVLFLLDGRARICAVFTPPFDVAAITTDIERARPYLKAGKAPSAT